MKLIPAIDLKNNKVVFASGGDRNYYKKPSTDLSPTSDPIKFIEYLISLYNFNTIYLADLDSIKKYNAKNYFIDTLLCKYKNINFIIDNGVRDFTHINRFKSKNYTQIIATESFFDYTTLLNENYENFILSLDYKESKIISKNDDYKILKPKKVICMNLDSIGSDKGPNYKNIILTKKNYQMADIIASGGIRNNEDISKLKKEGIKESILLTAILRKNISYYNL